MSSLARYQSPLKQPGGTASTLMLGLSPGPEKAKLHQEVIASLLGLCGNTSPAKDDYQLPLEDSVQPIPEWQRSDPDESTGAIHFRRPIITNDISTGVLDVPADIFSTLFGPPSLNAKDVTALVESAPGSLLALAGSRIAGETEDNDSCSYALRVATLFAAMATQDADVLVLSTCPEASASGAAPRAIARLERPSTEFKFPVPATTNGKLTANGGRAYASPGSPHVLGEAHGVAGTATKTPGGEEALAPATVNNVHDNGAVRGDAEAAGSEAENLLEVDNDAAEAAAVLTVTKAAQTTSEDGLPGSQPTSARATGGLRGFLSKRNSTGQQQQGALGDEDPDWQTKPKSRGRPRKRKPFSTAAGGAAAGTGGGGGGGRAAADTTMHCSHCNTTETPRWWKDNFPVGTLCNACGIWLKRHGYPRPVQFFVNPATTAAAAAAAAAAGGGAVMAAAAPTPAPASQSRSPAGQRAELHPTAATALAAQQQQQQQQQHQQTSAAMTGGPTGSGGEEFYLINGRPKRRKAGGHFAGRYAAVNEGLLAQEESRDSLVGEGAEGGGVSPTVNTNLDAPIDFNAAGGKVFVMKRKLVKSDTDASVTTAANIHFGWSPTARASHSMYDAVAAYEDKSTVVAVDDFELLSDCKATATLSVKEGAEAPGNWDVLIRDFLEAL